MTSSTKQPGLMVRDIRFRPAPARRVGRGRGFRLTPRDGELLEFIAAHRFALACQVQALLARDRAVAYRRLQGLLDHGLLSYRRIFHGQPGVFQVTHGGLALIDSRLPKPKIDLQTYRHDVGVAWLWIYAHQGQFGPARQVMTERELRCPEQSARHLGARGFRVPIDGFDRAGRPRVHHPDLLLLDDSGRPATALELELSLKARRRLESIVLGYATGGGAQRVVYLTDRRSVLDAATEAVSNFGLDGFVRVVYVAADAHDPQWWMWRSLTRLGVAGR